MAEGQRSSAVSAETGLATGVLASIAAGAVWVVGAGLYVLLSPDAAAGFEGLHRIVAALGIVVPAALCGVAGLVFHQARVLQAEVAALQVAVSALRTAYVSDKHGKAAAPTVEARLNEIAQTARKTESTLATFTTTRDGSRAKPAIAATRQDTPDDQPTLALGTAADDNVPPLSREDFIKALNFPDNDKDTAGFNALRRALKDRTARQLVQAAQDVLTLLSQDGIYMDDLNPDRARPEVWRRFATGERGRAMAGLGGIRDRSSLALSAGRMREDTIFRDAAHHFLRLFDKTLVTFEAEASDAELADLADTRTARAFMLLGRVTGAFD